MGAAAHVRDRELLRRTRSGEAEAFGTFFRAHRGTVLAFFRVRGTGAEVTADLVAETFARALAAVHHHDRELPVIPIAWLLTIARNLLTDSRRRGRVEDDTRRRLAMEPLRLSDRDLDDVDQLAQEADLRARLAKELPPDELRAFVARVLDEHDYQAIAEDLRTSESVIRKRVSRARRRLRLRELETP